MEDTDNLTFQIKGIREGLLIIIGAGEWTDIQQQLLEHIRQNAKFFVGARLAVDAGSRNLNAAELGKFRDVLCDLDTSLWAVLSESPITAETARMLGLATKIKLQKSDSVGGKLADQQIGENEVMLEKTIRSGVKIISGGHVIVFGDLNPGGEIVANGSIIIWGHCRGNVHAGAQGAQDTVVCALDLSPNELRIAELMAAKPKRRGKSKPEMAYIQANQVVAEPWNPKAK